MSFFSELKRRNVTRVAIAYLVLSWLMAQVAEMLLETFGAPDWVFKTLLALFVIGFPFALFFAWAFELTPDGLKKEKDIDHSQPEAKQSRRKLDVTIIGLLVIALAYFIYEGRSTSPTPVETKPITTLEETTEPAIEPVVDEASVAVIPFLNLSSDKEQAYFSDGLADTILHMLAQIPDLRVAARTSSFKFKDKNEDMREIAALLGVAMVLEGSVQRQGERVRITVQLIRGADGSHIWSQVYDDTMDDIFRVQDEIATGVADAMLATPALADSDSGAAPGIEIESLGGTSNVAAYDAFLRGQTALDKRTADSVNKALVLLQLAVELDPGFARAWVALSWASYYSAELGNASWQAAGKDALIAAEKAVALEPRMASAHIRYAFALRGNDGDPKLVETAILKAYELEPNNAEALSALASLKAMQNKHRESLVLTEKAVLINPLDTDLKVDLVFRKMSVGLVDEALSEMTRIASEQPDDLRIQRSLYWLYNLTGNILEAEKLNGTILKNNPNLLDPLFAAAFRHRDLNDLEVGDQYLKRIELLAPKRAFDDRYFFCMLTGDRACAEKSGALYLELLRNEDSEAAAETFEAEYALYMGKPQRSIELLEPKFQKLFDDDETLDLASVTYITKSTGGSLHLALAYGIQGELEKRDRVLGLLQAKINERLANGLWPALATDDLAVIAAVSGDAKLTAERLALVQESGAQISSSEIDYDNIFDMVRDDPAVKIQRDRLRAREDALRERLYAEGIWQK